jgi:hypothetical protein
VQNGVKEKMGRPHRSRVHSKHFDGNRLPPDIAFVDRNLRLTKGLPMQVDTAAPDRIDECGRVRSAKKRTRRK